MPAAVVPAPSMRDLEVERRRHALAINFGVNVAGYFTAELGVGQAARLLVAALDAAEVPLLPLLPSTLPPSRNDHRYATVPAAAGFCSSALPSGIQSPWVLSIAGRSSRQRR